MTPRLVLISCLFFLGAAAAPKDANRFRNATAGFEVTKPAKWQFATAEQTRENLGRTKLSDREFQEAMVQYATTPMVSMLKHPEPFDDINPSFRVNVRALGELKGKSPVEIAGVFVAPLQKAFKDCEVKQPPKEVVVSGLKAAYIRFDYSLGTTSGASFPTTSELWIVPRGDYFFMIGAGTRQDEMTGTRNEIAAILKTVKIDHSSAAPH